MSEGNGTPQRYHALDGLRAAMMLLGVVLHTASSYTVRGAAWPFHDAAATPIADRIVVFIHIFRMPAFFLMSGFFGALLLARRGPSSMARNRIERVVVPLLVGLAVLTPLVVMAFAFSLGAKAGGIAGAIAAVKAVAAKSSTYVPESTLHLWFLYYLVYFYAGALLLAALYGRAPAALRDRVALATGKLVENGWLRLVVLAGLTTATLIPAAGMVGRDTGLVRPNLDLLVIYSVFFWFGWVLYSHRQRLGRFERFAWAQLAAGVVVFLAILPVREAISNDPMSSVSIYVRSVMGGFATWLLVFGFTGLFLRYLDRHSPRVRYMVDASYWIYLVHLPLTACLPGLVATAPVSAWLKMAFVLVVTTILSIATYDLFVRSTFVGRVLNGRRYPRGLPR